MPCMHVLQRTKGMCIVKAVITLCCWNGPAPYACHPVPAVQCDSPIHAPQHNPAMAWAALGCMPCWAGGLCMLRVHKCIVRAYRVAVQPQQRQPGAARTCFVTRRHGTAVGGHTYDVRPR